MVTWTLHTVTLELAPKGYPSYRQPRSFANFLLLPKQVRKTLNLRDVERRRGTVGRLHAESADRRGETGSAVPGTVDVNWRIGAIRGSFADHLFSYESWHEVAVVLMATVPRIAYVWVL